MAAARQLEYLRIAVESAASAYGTAGSSWEAIPFDTYEVGPEDDAVEMDKFTGAIDHQYIDNTYQRLTGRATAQIWPDNCDNFAVATSNLLAFAGLLRDPNYGYDVPAYTVQGVDMPGNVAWQQTGVKCDTCRITCSMDTPKLMLEMDLIGKRETRVSSFALPSYPSQASFDFSEAAFTSDTVAEANIKSFSIEVRNNLQGGPADTTKTIKWLDASRRQIGCDFSLRRQPSAPVANAVDYNEMVLSMRKGLAFVATFTKTSATPISTLTFTLGNLVLVRAPRTGGVGDIQELAVSTKGALVGATAWDALVVAAAA